MRRLVGETLATKAAVAALLITSGCADDPTLEEVPTCIQLSSVPTADGSLLVSLAINAVGLENPPETLDNPGFIDPDSITHYIEGQPAARAAGDTIEIYFDFEGTRRETLVAVTSGLACQLALR